MKKKIMALRLAFLSMCLLLVTGGSPAISQSLDEIVETQSNTDLPLTGQLEEPAAEPAVETVKEADNAESVRQQIVGLVESMVGKVQNKAGEDGNKIGWQNLKNFYEVAYKIDDLEKERSWWMKDIKGVGKKVNDWCGIFGVWAWRKAGLPVYWNTRIIGCPYRGKLQLLGPGDIVIIKKSVNPYNHHCIVKSVDGENVVTVDGNQGMDSIQIKNRKLKDIEIFYSVAEAFSGKLPPSTVTPPTKPAGTSQPANPGTTAGNTATGNSNGQPATQIAEPAPDKPLSEKEMNDLLQQIFNLVRIVIGPFC